MVSCGKCHEGHATVAEVRACYGVDTEPAIQASPGKPITDKQSAFITSLLTKLGTTADAAGIDLATLDRASASALIDALSTKVREAKAKPTTQQPQSSGGKEPKPGTYTLVRSDGSYRTLQIAHAKWADGKLVASYLAGSDNELSYKGFAFVNGGKPAIWKKFKDDSQLAADLRTFLELDDTAVGHAHDTFLDQAEAYALKSGRCMRCGLKLTVPASLHRGLGPVCAGVEGVA